MTNYTWTALALQAFQVLSSEKGAEVVAEK